MIEYDQFEFILNMIRTHLCRHGPIIKSAVMSRKQDSIPDEYLDNLDYQKDEIFESDGLASGPQTQGNNRIMTAIKNDKKDTKLLNFLSKMDSKFFNLLEDFVRKYQGLFKPNPFKPISIFEDVLVMYEFKKEENKIRQRKKEAVESLLKKLETKIGRKPVTIKERIEKKLSNLTIDDLRGFIEDKQDISFNTKKELNTKGKQSHKSNFNYDQMNNLDTTPQKVDKRQMESKKTNGSSFVQEVKEERKASKVEVMKKVEEPSKKSMFSKEKQTLYRHGDPSINQPIKIFYDRKKKILIPFKKSIFETITNEEDQQNGQKRENESKGNVQERKQNQNIQKERRRKEQKKQKNNNLPEVTVKINKQAQESIKNYFKKEQKQNLSHTLNQQIQEIKSQIITVISNSGTSQNNFELDKIRNLQEGLTKLQKLQIEWNRNNEDQEQEPIKKQQRPRRKERQGVSDSDIPQDESHHSSRKSHLFSTGRKTLPELNPSRSQRDIFEQMSREQQQIQIEKLKHSMCDNQEYFRIVTRNPSQLPYYRFDDDEDKLIYSFKFSPNNYRTEMICMLRYKSLDKIKERMNYLKLDIDAKTMIELERLTPAGREKENAESKELAEVSIQSDRTDILQSRSQRMDRNFD